MTNTITEKMRVLSSKTSIKNEDPLFKESCFERGNCLSLSREKDHFVINDNGTKFKIYFNLLNNLSDFNNYEGINKILCAYKIYGSDISKIIIFLNY